MKKFLTVLVLAGGAGLLYTHLEIEAVKIGYTIQKQDQIKTQFIDRARALKYNIARMKAPNNLERKLSARKVSLESPRTWQTLVISGGQKGLPQDRSIGTSLFHGLPLSRFFIGTAQAEAKENAGR